MSDEERKTYTWSFAFVQMFSRRQFGKLLQVFRAQGIGNRVFFAEPFAEVNKLATM